MSTVQSTTRSDVFIIVASGDQRDEHYRIVALEPGADDYVPKPFSSRSCWLGQAARAGDPKRGGFCFGGWQLGAPRSARLEPSH
jgi:hypothetical protein